MDLNGARVAVWFDLSGNERHLSEGTNNQRPILYEDTLASHNIVAFDGANDILSFDEVANVRTVIVVLRESESANAFCPVIGDDDEFPFFRGPNGELWHPEFTDDAVLNGTARMGFESVNGLEAVIPQGQFQVISMVTTDDVSASQFGRDRSTPLLFTGDVAEIMLFSEPLDEATVQQLESELADYYSPQLDLGPDIVITDNLCDTTLIAATGFSSYLWSTGEETPSISVQQNGAYWVQATDAFGRVLSDTVNVTYPGQLNGPPATLACLGESVLWETELSDADYDFNWSTDEMTSAIELTEPGAYALAVTGPQGCTYTTPEISFEIDSFSTLEVLPAAAELCTGNLLTIDAPGETLTQIEWQDGSEEPAFTVLESGTYSVTATNANGCVVEATTDVTIIGEAPDVQILVPPVLCENAAASLQGSASAPGVSISSWEWTLPDTEQTASQDVVWTPQQPGETTLQLLATTNVGCTGLAELVLPVYPQPQGTITVEGGCEDDEVLFSTSPEISSGTVQSVEWFFAAEAADGNNVVFIPDSPGFEAVELVLTSNAGCVNTIEQLINVLPAPVPSVTVNDGCLGDQLPFSGSVDTNGAGLLTNTTWFFGDGGTSSQLNTAHLYATPGAFNITLQATAQNGCTGATSTVLNVYNLPDADFPVSDACLNAPFILNSTTAPADGDPIADWQWVVEDLGTFNGESVEAVWTTTGFKEVTLTTTSETGCSDARTKNVVVHELPEAAFTFDPLIGAPPLEVNFTNTSLDAVTANWFFGDEATSGDFSPNHTYIEEGSYAITLVVTNVFGCTDTTTRQLDVTEPVTDLRLEALFTTQTALGTQVTAQVINNGNYPVEALAFRLQQGNGSALTEVDNTLFMPGEVRNFTFTAQLIDSELLDPWGCVEVNAVNPIVPERDATDNKGCVDMGASDSQLRLFPNPVNQGDVLRLRFVLREAANVTVRVIDASGRQVYATEESFEESGFNEWLIPTQDLGAGMYTLQLRSERQSQRTRFQVR